MDEVDDDDNDNDFDPEYHTDSDVEGGFAADTMSGHLLVDAGFDLDGGEGVEEAIDLEGDGAAEAAQDEEIERLEDGLHMQDLIFGALAVLPRELDDDEQEEVDVEGNIKIVKRGNSGDAAHARMLEDYRDNPRPMDGLRLVNSQQHGRMHKAVRYTDLASVTLIVEITDKWTGSEGEVCGRRQRRGDSRQGVRPCRRRFPIWHG